MTDATHTIVATERAWAGRVLVVVACCLVAVLALAKASFPFSVAEIMLLSISALRIGIDLFHIARAEVSVGLIPIALSAVWPTALASYNATGGTASLLCTVACCWTTCFVIVWFFRMGLAARPEAGAPIPSSAIILGCAVKDGRPSATLQLRLDAAVGLWREHPETVFIVTGGVSDPGEPSEAYVMASCLADAGIPSEQIVVENRALNTEENLANTRELMELGGLGSTAWLVTSDYHMWRAGRIADGVGITTVPCAAPTPFSTNLMQWCREVLVICFGR